MAGPKHILITGGTSGIGLALAARLSQRHRVLVTGRRMSEKLSALMSERPDIDFLSLDFLQPETIIDATKAKLESKNWQHIDYAVLNAGTGQVSDPAEESGETLRQTINVNVSSNIAMAQALFPYLSRKYGKMTFVGSTARKGAANFASYAASKSGLHGLARALKEEWRGKVAVQIVHPGPTKTDMHQKAGLKIGAIRAIFVPAESMAGMIENAMARNRFSVNLGPIHYWSGSAFLGRGLR